MTMTPKPCPHCESPVPGKGKYCTERCQRRAAEQRSRRKHRCRTRLYQRRYYEQHKAKLSGRANAYYATNRKAILNSARRRYRGRARAAGDPTQAEIRARMIALQLARGNFDAAERLARGEA
jgi:hypothetical protein